MTDYERLPGSGISFLGVEFATIHTLWLGKDHVLSVAASGFRENYRRFYFKDIEAIVVKPNSKWRSRNIVWGGMVFVAVLGMLSGLKEDWNAAGLIAMGIMLAFLLAVFLLNLIRGAACSTYFKTAVQTEEIHALERMRDATVTVSRLKQVVEGVQGAITAEDVGRWDAALAEDEEVDPAPVAVAAPPVIKKVKHIMGRAHLVLFVLFLADLFDTIYEMTTGTHGYPQWFLLVLFVVIVFFMVSALIRQVNSDLPLKLKVLVWSSTVYIAAAILFVLIYTTVLSVSELEESGMVRGMPSSQESVVVLVYSIISGICSGLIGMLGLFWLYMFRKETDLPPTMPASPVA